MYNICFYGVVVVVVIVVVVVVVVVILMSPPADRAVAFSPERRND